MPPFSAPSLTLDVLIKSAALLISLFSAFVSQASSNDYQTLAWLTAFVLALALVVTVKAYGRLSRLDATCVDGARGTCCARLL